MLRLIRSIQLKASPIELRLECSLSGNWSVWDGGIWRRTRCTSICEAIKWAENHCGITLPAKANQPDVFPHEFAEFVAEMSVHQQLAAAKKELADLRKDREAWDIVRDAVISTERQCQGWRITRSQPLPPGVAWTSEYIDVADPREAVLALKGQLEGGK